jgi:hypothetical protein
MLGFLAAVIAAVCLVDLLNIAAKVRAGQLVRKRNAEIPSTR